MTRNEYNGWTNYETWVVKLWMDNSEGDNDAWREQAEECVGVDGKDDAVISLADIMRERYENDALDQVGENGVFCDLMNGALSEVNWREIAKHYVDEVETEETTKE